jgi:glycerol-3-phosphate dehydrogenase
MLYGTNTAKVLDLCLQNPQLKNKIAVGYEDIEAQIVYAIRYESAYTIDDILQRRLTIGLSTDTIETNVVQTISHHLSEEFELVARQHDKDIKALLTQGY